MQILSHMSDSRLDELAAGRVFVFRLSLDPADSAWRERVLMLAAEERARVERYPFAGDAARFAQSRLALRSALGTAVGCPPELVDIETTECGKPLLSERQARALGTPERLSFNVSHAGDVCLIALGAFDCLGIDVEERVDCDDLQTLAHRFFAPKEAERISALPHDEQVSAFYTCWTRKEALIKALGHGMGQYGIDKYEVFHAGEACDCLLSIPGGPEEASRWTIQDVGSGNVDYAAALAVRGVPAEIVVADWRG